MRIRKAIIFDFDGVIADSTRAKLEVALDIIKEMKIEIAKIDLKNATIILKKDGYLKLLGIMNFPIMKVPKLIAEVKKRQFNAKDTIKPIEGIPEILQKISVDNDLFILTGNSKEYIYNFLHEYKIYDYFKEILSDSLDMGKERLFNEFKIKYPELINRGIYIGDEPEDIINSHKIGLKCVAVSWGITSRKRLLNNNPYAIADKPIDILKFIK